MQGTAKAIYPVRFRGFAEQNAAYLLCALALLIILAKTALPDFLIRLPESVILPYQIWLQAFFDFVKDDLGLIYLTRFLSSLLESLLGVTSNLFFGKHRWPFIGPIPWTALAGAAVILAYWLGGWRTALIALVTCLWVALVGQWKLTMQTLSVIFVAAPLAIAIGLVLGVAAWRFPKFEKILAPLLSVLQTLPFFTYLLPAIIFFKVGPTAGCVATIAFAMPPMIRMTALGLKQVSSDTVEAGLMCGSSKWQMLRYVYIPSARQEILVGVNQVIMLSLAMVVLTAFIGMPGLGAKLLSLMNSLKLGRSIEIGITIVLIAVMLDRCSKAWVYKLPEHFPKGSSFWKRHSFLVSGLLIFIGFIILAQFWSLADQLSRSQNLSMNKQINTAIDLILKNDSVNAVTEWLRWFLITWVLIPFRDAMLWIPFSSIILCMAALGYWVGGWRSAALAGGFFLIIAMTGWWDRAIITLYAVFAAVLIASIIGIPLGIVAATRKKWAEPVLIFCDTAQTFPSFVYLIPAIMLFGVNDVAVIFAIFIFATVPFIRYTIEGLRSVPEELIEAADMSGTTRRQKLINVQLPIALPVMAIGFSQAILFAFFMVIIAAFIGTQDLGQELQRTLAGNELGKNFVLGICVSLMALTFDHIIMKWSEERRKILGVA